MPDKSVYIRELLDMYYILLHLQLRHKMIILYTKYVSYFAWRLQLKIVLFCELLNLTSPFSIDLYSVTIGDTTVIINVTIIRVTTTITTVTTNITPILITTTTTSTTIISTSIVITTATTVVFQQKVSETCVLESMQAEVIGT